MSFVREFDPRPVPNTACCWHKGDINCVQISTDGFLIASAGERFHDHSSGPNLLISLTGLGDDGRILVSDTTSGNILYKLEYKNAKINAIIWLQSVLYPQLAGGCSDGTIIVWKLIPGQRPEMKIHRTFIFEVEMLEYDFASDSVLVAFRDALGMCSLQLSEKSDMPENAIYKFDTEIGGIGILASGTKCIATLPGEKSM
jgi:hypothetical protein